MAPALFLMNMLATCGGRWRGAEGRVPRFAHRRVILFVSFFVQVGVNECDGQGTGGR